ncbi:MAG: uroporphyrinogen-III C-methyltransferase [Eubacterium sp.]
MVYLVGAGPGDPGLMTRRGAQVLQECEAVVYDRLGTNGLLELVPEDCEKIYVGKKPGSHSKKQEEINEILINTAKRYDCVVRLKGGDPFVFGRGGEEILALQQENIPFQLVPGVTSAIAVPELLGIPVSHRETSRCFHVFTGHTRAGEETSLAHIHPQEGTSLFLMGISHIKEIADKLICEGKDPQTPAAVITNGCMPGERIVRGTLATIAQEVIEAGLKPPAIIIIGETAAYEFISPDRGTLADKKVGIIGTYALQERMRRHLLQKGARVYTVCEMKVVETAEVKKLEEELKHLSDYSWIAFTSQNSIRLFFTHVFHKKIDLRRFASIRFAVVGSGTRDALREYGFEADLIPEKYTTEALAESLVSAMKKGEKLLLPRALQGSVRMTQILEENKIDKKVLPIYDVKGQKTENWKFLLDFDILTFASASGVEAFVKELGVENVTAWEENRRKNQTKIGAIGAITAEKLEKYGIHADIVPKQCDIEHLIEEMAKEREV